MTRLRFTERLAVATSADNATLRFGPTTGQAVSVRSKFAGGDLLASARTP